MYKGVPITRLKRSSFLVTTLFCKNKLTYRSKIDLNQQVLYPNYHFR